MSTICAAPKLQRITWAANLQYVPLHSGHLLSARSSSAAGRLCCAGNDLAAVACCSFLQPASAQLLR